jgi:hypothetical protein
MSSACRPTGDTTKNHITVPETDRPVSPRAGLGLPDRRQPIIILKARGTQQEKIEDPAYASQAWRSRR